MTTRPADAVFGLPDPRWEAPAATPIANLTDNQNNEGAAEIPPGTETQWVNSELQTIASTIEQLQSRLEQANSRLSDAEKVETTEYEIGRLFVEAQRFSEDSLANLELKLHEVLSAAETKAIQILAEATEEAQRIRLEAQEAAFASTQTVRELQSAISGFTTVNAELLKELGALNGMLSPSSNPASDQLGPSSRAGTHFIGLGLTGLRSATFLQAPNMIDSASHRQRALSRDPGIGGQLPPPRVVFSQSAAPFEIDFAHQSLEMVRDFIEHLADPNGKCRHRDDRSKAARVDWAVIRAAVAGSPSIEQAIGRALVIADRMRNEISGDKDSGETLVATELKDNAFFGFSVTDAVPDFGDESRYRTRMARRFTGVFGSTKRSP